jgi:hypothetical protein
VTQAAQGCEGAAVLPNAPRYGYNQKQQVLLSWLVALVGLRIAEGRVRDDI